MKNLIKFIKSHFIGLLGLIMLQSNSLPAVFYAIETGKAAPVSTILMTLGGLSCYLWHSVIETKNTLYTIGNCIGLLGNSILLYVVLTVAQ